MFEEEQYQILYRTLKRIFSLPITRSTFRELQKTVLTFCHNETDRANELLNSLLLGKLQGEEMRAYEGTKLEGLLDEFCVASLVAKDIFERGEFISLVTSDFINQGNRLLLVNRMRRIDGEEYQFITDIETTLNIVNHFASRIQELDKDERTKGMIEASRNQLIMLRGKIEQMLGSEQPS